MARQSTCALSFESRPGTFLHNSVVRTAGSCGSGHGVTGRQLPLRLVLRCGVTWQTHRTASLRGRPPRLVAWSPKSNTRQQLLRQPAQVDWLRHRRPHPFRLGEKTISVRVRESTRANRSDRCRAEPATRDSGRRRRRDRALPDGHLPDDQPGGAHISRRRPPASAPAARDAVHRCRPAAQRPRPDPAAHHPRPGLLMKRTFRYFDGALPAQHTPPPRHGL
jgi:hypothetical protein